MHLHFPVFVYTWADADAFETLTIVLDIQINIWMQCFILW